MKAWEGMRAKITGYLLLAFAPLIVGCQSCHKPDRPTVETLREKWRREWAYSLGKPIGLAYDDYAPCRNILPRGREFEEFASTLQFVESSVTGERCLDVLGYPDVWRVQSDGDVGFIYYFTSGGIQNELYIRLKSGGQQIDLIGWNVAGVNNVARMGYHP